MVFTGNKNLLLIDDRSAWIFSGHLYAQKYTISITGAYGNE